MRVTLRRGRPQPSDPVWRTVAPYGVWLVLSLGSSMVSVHWFAGTWFANASPGGSPPWYFIGQDLVDAAWAAGAATAMVTFTLLAAPQLGPNVWAALGVAQIGFAATLSGGINILLHTRSAWQPGEATSEWVTYRSFAISQSRAVDLGLCIGTVLAIACMWQFRRALLHGRDGTGGEPRAAEQGDEADER
jgi:hypothetical protein